MARPARRALTITVLLTFAAALALAIALATHGATAGSSNPPETYNQWVAEHAAESLDGNILAITLIEDDPRSQQPGSYTFTVGVDGQVSWRSSDDFGIKGGGGNPVDPQSLTRLKQLAAQLPADGGILPPPERRILVQTAQAKYVYDRAELPDRVAELFRLSGCTIGSWCLTFAAQREVDVRAGGLLTLFPDGKRFLCGTQVLAIPTYETLGDLETNENFSDVAISPDGKLAALAGFNCQIVDMSTLRIVRVFTERSHGRSQPVLVDPHFTPDGRSLMLRVNDLGRGEDGFFFYDTTTWQTVHPIVEIPRDTVQWDPSPSWRHAVMRSWVGAISIWDAKTRSARELDPASPLFEAVFSPDESMVALVTSDKDGYSNPRLRIFQTASGKLVHELRVGEIGCDGLKLAQWTPDGRYIMAVTKPDRFFSDENISIWSVKTGRHRGDFAGCADLGGFLLLPGGNELIAPFIDGKLHIWDFKAAIREIQALEESLARSSVP
ncbi:MAG TPA: WD40 repeat domain-containing protein [Tepidisphaeraceae bacterium]|nr:WD40 repeat domain-containing protein [Tepidisphaeraceae bacterium]